MKKTIFIIMLVLLSTTVMAENFLDKIRSNHKYIGDGNCDAGENPITHSDDCKIELNNLLDQIWFAKLIIILLVLLFIFYKKSNQIYIVVGIILLLFAFGIHSGDFQEKPEQINKDSHWIIEKIEDIGRIASKNYPMIGFTFIAMIVLIIWFGSGKIEDKIDSILYRKK